MSGPAIAYAAIGGLQMWSALQQADQIRANARLQERIGRMNARFAEIDAYEAEKMGFSESARYQNVVDDIISDQRTIMAANNIDITTGTAKELQEESRLTGFLNQLDVQKNARAKALGLKVEASNIRLGNSMTGIQSEINAGATTRAGIMDAARYGVEAYRRF